MVFREVSVIEIREALRAWLAGKSERAVAAQAGVDRKTSKRYVTAAVAAGLSRDGGEGQRTDELIGQVVSVVRPVRPDGHGQGWAELEARREQIAKWAEAGVPVVKIGILLARQGVVAAERTLHRFAAERCGAAGSKVTTPVDDGPPGSELQIDFGDLGLIPAGEGRRRKLRALVFTACFSRHMFVYLTFSMTLEEVIAGCEDAWEFFSGVFRVVVPDNMSPVVADADAVNPRLTREWLEYAQARGFVTDPARVRHPRDKPRVEAGVKFVQGNFFAGETFLDLADARSRMAAWLELANARVHGSTRQVPAVVFAAREAPCLLPAPAERYQVPYWAEVKVHVDYHIQVARALYSVPWRHVGARALDVDVINVSKIESMLKNATETIPAAGLAAAGSPGPGRFARDAAEYATATGVRLQVVDGGSAPARGGRSSIPLIYFIPRFSPHFFSSPERKRKRRDSAMTSQIPDQMPLPGSPATDGARRCKQPGCGAGLPAATGRGAPRVFCSPACSRKWHNDSRVSASPPAAAQQAAVAAGPLAGLHQLLTQAAELAAGAAAQLADADPGRVTATLAAADAARRQAQAETAVALARAAGAVQAEQAATAAMHAAQYDARAALEAAADARADADAADAGAQTIRDQADAQITQIRQQADAALASARDQASAAHAGRDAALAAAAQDRHHADAEIGRARQAEADARAENDHVRADAARERDAAAAACAAQLHAIQALADTWRARAEHAEHQLDLERDHQRRLAAQPSADGDPGDGAPAAPATTRPAAKATRTAGGGQH